MARSSSPRGSTPGGRFPPIAAALALAAQVLAAQELGPRAAPAQPLALPPEAPASLFSTKLGEGSAEFLARGAWELGVKAGAGLRIDRFGGVGAGDPPYALFTQRPDLFLSFLLFERVFVEARVGEDLSQARYVLGYREELPGGRRELRVGNDGISFPALPRLGFGEGPRSSFGLAATWVEGPFAANLMLRYDQAARRSLTVYGGRELSESPIGLAAFIRGRFFVLAPAAFEDFAVFARSDSGSLLDEAGKRYRRLEASEYRLLRSTGELELSEATESELYVAHSELTSGDARIGDREALLIYQPDSWPVGGFERLSRYALPARSATASKEAGGLEVLLKEAATGLPDESYRLRIDPEGYLEVLHPADPPLGSALHRQPFADLMPWLYTEAPDPEASEGKPYAPAYSRVILLREYAAAEGVTLGQGYLPGSVHVLRDGLPDLSFSVDPATRILTLSRPPALAERIDVSWLEASEERRAGSLAAGLGLVVTTGKDSRAYAALGGRLSLPGTGYAVSGALDPGEAVFVAGLERRASPLSYELGLAARWATPVLSGVYRIAGMEEGGAFGSAFRPSPDSSGGAAEEIQEGDGTATLQSSFPEELARLHPETGGNKVLAIRATAAAAAPKFLRYIDPAPLASLGILSFFAKGPANAVLTLALEGAEGRKLRLELPAGSLAPEEWRRFSLRYAAAEPSVAYRGPSGGADLPPPGAIVEAPASLAEAGLLRLELSGLAAGDEVLIDEILLEEGRGAGALLADASLGLALPALLLGSPDLPLLKGLALSMSGSGALQDAAYARGEFRLAGQVSLAAIGLDARLAADESGLLGWKLGHKVELPIGFAPFGLTERFDYDPGDGAFGREETLRLDAGGLARLQARTRLEWRPLSAASGRLAQEWSAQASILGALGFELAASQATRPAWSGLGAGEAYSSAWLQSYPYLAPAFESSASERKLGAGATLSLPFPGARRGAEGWELAFESRRLLGSKLQLAAATGGSGSRRGDFGLDLSLPVFLPGGARVELGYGRSAAWSLVGGGESLFGLATEAFDLLADFPELIASPPIAELGLADSIAPLESWRAAAAARGLELAALSYVPRLSLGMSRPLGSAWTELLLPSSIQASVARRLLYEKGTGLEALELEGKLGFAAINLFGLLGSSPLFDFYESEELSSGLSGRLRLVSGDSIPELSLGQRLSLVVYVQDPATAGSTPTSLALDQAASYASAPTGTSWSEKLELTYALRREEHWLLALFGLLVDALGAGPVGVARAGNPDGAERRALSSAWLEGLRSGRPRARDSYLAALELSGKSSQALPSIRLREGYEARLSLARALTAHAKLEASQSYDGASGAFDLGFALTLAATLQF